jgi:hypothetical protein
MKQRFRLYRRNGGIYYIHDDKTGKQESLRTRDRVEASALFAAKSQSHRQAHLNLRLARTYLAATDPMVAKRTWQVAMEELVKTKRGATHERWQRAITWEEHQAIVTRELNPERKAFYHLAWHLGASQSDLACLEAENIDWEHNVISFARKKTGSIAIMRFDDVVAEILRDLPGSGPLFPYLRTVRSGDRATEFHQRIVGLGIKGVTLHLYRYAWAERAKKAGYPERFAQEALGHNSKAIHRAYARRAQVELPPLSAYERLRNQFSGNSKMVEPLPQILNT